MAQREKTAGDHSILDVKLDRLVLYASASDRNAFRDQPEHRVRRSQFLWSGVYRRILETVDTRTGARTRYYDLPRVPWVPKVKVVLIAGDVQGLTPSDLLSASELLKNPRVSLLELALDFPEQAGLTTGFVLEHIVFGKSRWTARKFGIVWFGTRRSSKFVRAYKKHKLGVFRVELEFHAGWLRHHGVRDLFDFARLPDLIVRRHIFFCRLDWPAVIRNIRRCVPNSALALRNLKWQQHDLHATLRYLRRELRFTNTHRYLLPLALNNVVARALNRWAAQWPERPFTLRRRT